MNTLVYIAFIFGVSTLIFGCNNKRDDGGTPVVVRGGDRGAGAGGTTVMQGYNGQTVVLTSTQDILGFQQNVVNFLSPTLPPEAIGQIQSVEMLAQVVTDPNSGNMDPSKSFVQFTIKDNYYMDSQQQPPIVLRINGKQGYASNFTTDLVFEDSYSQVRITGSYDGPTLQGNVSFSNSNPSSTGTLGSFSVSTCGFFYCAQ